MLRGIEDAIITLLNLIEKHLERSQNYACLLFIDFSSAFNYIQPNILAHRLMSNFVMNFNTVGWLMSFLHDRSIG